MSRAAQVIDGSRIYAEKVVRTDEGSAYIFCFETLEKKVWFFCQSVFAEGGTEVHPLINTVSASDFLCSARAGAHSAGDQARDQSRKLLQGEHGRRRKEALR